MLGGGLALIIVGSLLLAVDPHPLVLSLASLLVGAGFSAWMLGRQSYIADTCENHEVGRAIAVMAGLQRAGVFLGPALGGLLAARSGYPVAFVIGAVLAIVAAGFVFAFTRDVRHEDEGEAGFAATLGLMRSHAKVFATAGSAAFSLQLMRAMRQLLVPLFGQAIGLNAAEIGLIYSLSAGIDMCLFYPVGILIDRRGRRWSAIPSILLFAIGLGLLPAADGFYPLLVISLLLGVANGLGTGIVMIIGADFAQRTDQRGQFLGAWRLIGDLGMSASPLLSGALVSVTSLAAVSLAAAGIGVLGAIVMFALVPETLSRPES